MARHVEVVEGHRFGRGTVTRAARLLAIVVLLATGCVAEELTRVSVEPGPAPRAVVFVLNDLDLLYGLSVLTCRGRDMWTISNQRLGEPPTRIVYGVTPDGFVDRSGPTVLTPGCYDVIVSGPSRTRFRIGNDGRLDPASDSSNASRAARGVARAR